MFPADLGKMLLVFGLAFIVLGVVFIFAGRVPFLGRLPGDIEIRGKNFVFYFPITTMLFASAILSLVLWFFTRR